MTTRVCIVGTGIADRPELELVGVVAKGMRKRWVRASVSFAAGSGLRSKAPPWEEMPVVLGNSNADVLCCCGLAESANFDALSIVVNAVLDVVSLAGPTHFETGFGAARTADLIRRAEAIGSRVVATGLNPGFLLDVLPVACPVLAVTPPPVRARRASELGTWGTGC